MEPLGGNAITKLLPFHYHVRSTGDGFECISKEGLRPADFTLFQNEVARRWKKTLKDIVSVKGGGSFHFQIILVKTSQPSVRTKKIVAVLT